MRLILFLLLVGSPFLCLAQNRDDIYHNSKPPSDAKPLTAGDHLTLSANLQYAAIGAGASSLGINFLLQYLIANDPNFNPEESYSSNPYNAYLFAMYGLGALSAGFGIASIHHKRMAGIKLNRETSLRTSISPNRISLALVF